MDVKNEVVKLSKQSETETKNLKWEEGKENGCSHFDFLLLLVGALQLQCMGQDHMLQHISWL